MFPSTAEESEKLLTLYLYFNLCFDHNGQASRERYEDRYGTRWSAGFATFNLTNTNREQASYTHLESYKSLALLPQPLPAARPL
jgi:hypothetical protein